MPTYTFKIRERGNVTAWEQILGESITTQDPANCAKELGAGHERQTGQKVIEVRYNETGSPMGDYVAISGHHDLPHTVAHDAKETALLTTWAEYADDSLRAIATFKVKLELWRDNGNRERQAGDFQAAYKAVVNVVGDRWMDIDGLDELVDVLEGRGLPTPVERTQAQSEQATLNAVFGKG